MICPDCCIEMVAHDGGWTASNGVRKLYRICLECNRHCRVRISRGVEIFEAWVEEDITETLTWSIVKRAFIDDLIWFREVQPETLELIERVRNGI